MSTFSSLGIGSGLDANAIVSQLVALERRPIELLKGEATKIDARLSSFGRIQSALDAVRSAARTLTDSSTWRAASATSSDATAVGVTVSSGSTPGSYAVQVGRLAAAQMNASSALATAQTVVGKGTLRFEMGSWAADESAFTPRSGGSAIEVTIGDGEDTLEKIRDKINNTSGLDVRASIVNDASGARLVLQSRSTGADNGFRLQVVDDDGNATDAAGLSRLAYDPPAGATGAARTQAGVNAQATINGLQVESATNSMSNVIDGVSLTLGKVTTGAVDVSVSHDTASMRKSIEGFVAAYNDLVKLVREQTKYDEASKSAGPLQGDRTAIGILGQLRSVIGASSTASSSFARAADIGLQTQTDGTLKLDGSKLDEGFGALSQLQNFFAAATESSASSGLAVRLRALTDQMLGADGAVSSRQEGLRERKANNGKRQASLEDRIALTEKRLRAQYQALDSSMAKLGNLSNYVSQQVSNWNKA
ncbi:MAG: flagellar filament capping protein FliD [Rubrivivax sp.]|nr:flagellar filament capping protein FliD [Rubrivivax sp.]